MKKISLLSPGNLKVHNSDEEIILQKGTVKVKVNACGICGSDLALISGKRDMTKERYFGHEFSGVITEVSDESTGLRADMRVASELSRTCGQCWNCLNGLPNYCRNMNDALLPGGFTEETLVRETADYSFLSVIPDTIDDITASLLEPTNCAYHIAMQAKMKPGDTVAVFGLGAMGIIAAIILKSMGAGPVVGFGRSAGRLEQVRKTSLLDAVLRNDEEGRKQAMDFCENKGFDIVIEATGTAPVLQDAMGLVRYGGRVVVGSVYHGTIPEFNPLPIMRKEITIVGAKGPTTYRKTDGSSAVVGVMDRIQSDLKKIITVYDYEDALKAFDDARNSKAIKAVIRYN